MIVPIALYPHPRLPPFAQLDPCYPPGVVHDDGGLGVGNFTACRAVAADLLAHEGCAPSAAHSCIAGTPVPRWEGAMLAIENFHYTAEMLGLGQAPTLEEIAAAGGARLPALQPPSLPGLSKLGLNNTDTRQPGLQRTQIINPRPK